MAMHNAGLKVVRYTRQEKTIPWHVFSGGGYDLLFMPVNQAYGLLVAGNDIAAKERLLTNVDNLTALRNEVEKALRLIGTPEEVVAEVKKTTPMSAASSSPTIRLTRPVEVAPAPEMEALLKGATEKKATPTNADDFWNQAAEKHGSKPLNSDVISLEEARKMGLLPDDGK
jgi:hypothetical protein